jgi:transposase
VALRAQIILFAAAGASNRAIARALPTTLVTVLLWRKRFREGGPEALLELAPGRGPRRRISRRQIRQIVQATAKAPPAGIKRWSVRSLARAQGVSHGTIQRILDEYAVKAHLAGRPKSKEAGSVRGIVGLYLNPPDRLLAFALERLPAALARKKRAVPASSHEKPPAGAASWFEALRELESRVVGDSRWRPRQQAFLGFLRRLEREVPGEIPIHFVTDHEGTHAQDFAQAWFKHRPRLQVHPAPAGSTWLDWVAWWLRELTRKQADREGLPGTAAVEQVVRSYLADNPPQPQPFVWPAPQKKSLP